jgi:hypothetical protein
MDASRTSYELLAHFDRLDPASPCLKQSQKTRGVAWVLQWAAALVVLLFASVVLAEFVYCLTAEHTLARAAHAGALEATLPRASYKTIAQSIERRLDGYPGVAKQLRLVIRQNNAPLGARTHLQPGDRISVLLSAPSHAVLPGWLRTIDFCRNCTRIEAHAAREIPGRLLRPRGDLHHGPILRKNIVGE